MGHSEQRGQGRAGSDMLAQRSKQWHAGLPGVAALAAHVGPCDEHAPPPSRTPLQKTTSSTPLCSSSHAASTSNKNSSAEAHAGGKQRSARAAGQPAVQMIDASASVPSHSPAGGCRLAQRGCHSPPAAAPPQGASQPPGAAGAAGCPPRCRAGSTCGTHRQGEALPATDGCCIALGTGWRSGPAWMDEAWR